MSHNSALTERPKTSLKNLGQSIKCPFLKGFMTNFPSLSGKKGKKSKGISMSLHEFLDGSGSPTFSKPVVTGNWADDVDDEECKEME